MPDASKEFAWFHDTEPKGILGAMDAEGVVSFAIEAGVGSSVRGTTYFNAMMDFFGDAAVAIECLWVKGSSDRMSTNIDKVNEMTGAGVALPDAVLHAWTATRASKRGYCNVHVLGTPVGSPGAYSRIEVRIDK
jgi:hypothetical protein